MSVLKVEEGISDEKKKDVILHSDGIVSVTVSIACRCF